LEKWAVFFQYADVPKYRETVNDVIASKEALQVAGEIIMSVSKDERERAVFRSRKMYQTDMDSNFATAEERGRRKGLAEGRTKGLAEGRAEGRTEGILDMARKLKAGGSLPFEEIARISGLSTAEVEKL
jgi:predicted transposase/invertase (TIGR01784 family)